MILKGSQRGGARQLATHLMNDRDNDHVTLGELRGFVSDELYGAMAETQAVAKGTRCRQCVFSLSLNPPKDADVSRESFYAAADRAEDILGLSGQPRALVIHEKSGRMHAHVVWSRIDPEAMKAINLPFFKTRLNALSRELYLEHGWELPDGHKTNGWKNPLNFTLAEWQQAKRLDLDPRELKQVFHTAWERSDNLPSFRNALEEHGFYLAKGDRRGVVAIDIHGEVFSIARWTGVKAKEAAQRLRGFEALPGVDEAKAHLRAAMSKRLRGFVAQDRQDKRTELKPLMDELRGMVAKHRAERERMDKGQADRWQKETKARAARLRTGLGKVMDVLTGRLFKIRRENERDAFQGYLRDRAQRETLFSAQMKERRTLQTRIDAMQSRHRQARMRLARQIVEVLRPAPKQGGREPPGPERRRNRNRDMDMGL